MMTDKEKIDLMLNALKEISIWSDESNEKALKDPEYATMLWRGCVGLAYHTLNKVTKGDMYWVKGEKSQLHTR